MPSLMTEPTDVPTDSISRRSRPARRPLAATLGTALLLAMLAAAGCGDGEEEPNGRDDRATPAVEVVQARAGGLPLEEELNGVVKARNQVAIRPQIEATVTAVLVRSGEPVEAGQPLVHLDARDFGDQMRQAEASARQATAAAAAEQAQVAEIEAQFSRTRALHAEGLTSDMDLETQQARLAAARARAEQAAAQVDQARAAIEERRTESSRTVVRAPVSGRVGRRDVEVGMLVDPSTTLFLVGDFDELIVEVPLTEKLLAHVDEGTPVLVRSQALGPDPLRAELTRISPFLEANSFSTTGEVEIANRGGRLRPGMFVTVDVLYGESDEATLVPSSAVWEDPGSGELGVYVMQEPAELPAAVRAGEEISRQAYPFDLRPIEVLAEGEAAVGVIGVRGGEWVVIVGQHLLHDAAEGGEEDGPGRSGGARAAGAVADAAGPPTARVRGASWEDVLALQRLQREDLLEGFLEKQRVIARELGAEIPDDPSVVDELLRRRGGDGARGKAGG